uniref:Putative secreted metalloprotease n=2 Tax=Lutzomyia longipalpis TaxID=7200 RepID=A0A7G3AZ04_LUTLO
MKYLKIVIILVFLGIFFSLFSSTSGSVFRIQLGNQVEVDPEEISVTFEDVKGCDEAKQELKEVVEFLKNPDKFSNLGGKLPKGVLLVGPPGTGKTLLARAIAGEAGVPFFHAAGPEFDEVLVGQGARRVRDLFKAAKERAPCVIFIDEIDSVGAKRTNSVLHPYANQTINQLLSEMDGFHQNEGVIVLGATNRRDDLDQALLRPGRFDVEVVVPTPDFGGRKEILTLYLAKILHKDIDIDTLARGTTGFTGADLENMVNQAALRAAIDGAEVVTMKHLESARDKVLMGPEKKARVPDEEANKITAYHEGGHAIVAYFTKESHPIHKVTIMPRGPSLGHTSYIPEKERYHVTKAQLLAMMDTMMGGRAAEELVFGPENITSGAGSDLKQATSIATHMVKDWGMSERVGLRTIEGAKGLQPSESLGPNTVEQVDAEIKKILSDSYERAKAILKAHPKEHKALAEALLKYETLDSEDVKAIMGGSKISQESKTS